MNLNGGIDNDEYQKYVLGLNVPLWPDVQDVSGMDLGVMPSCTSLMIPGNSCLQIPVPPSLVLCDIMSTCHAHAALSLSCFVSVCVERLV